jgi:hypothetical protein
VLSRGRVMFTGRNDLKLDKKCILKVSSVDGLSVEFNTQKINNSLNELVTLCDGIFHIRRDRQVLILPPENKNVESRVV